MNRPKVNILHLVLSLQTGGLERLVSEMVPLTDSDRFDVSVCCLDSLGPFADQLIRQGYRVELFQRNQEHFDYALPFKMRKLLRQKRVHILHMHAGTYHHGMYGAIPAGIPVTVYTEHGRHVPDPRLTILADRYLSPFTSKIVAVSRDLEEYMINKVGVSSKKVITILNGINTDLFSRRDKNENLLKEFGLSSQDIIIGSVGRLAEVKDYRTLLEAFKIVVGKEPSARLLMVGDGPEKDNLISHAEDIQLGDSVMFLGNREDIPYLLNLLDVFAMSSISEGTSVSLLEAMSSEIPAVVTDVGGNKDIIRNGSNGILVVPKNPVELAEKILSVIGDSGFAKSIGAGGRETVLKRFSLKVMMQKYTALYLQLLGAKRKYRKLIYG